MSETELQKQIAIYITMQYPDIMFHSDYGSGVKLTPWQAKTQKIQNGGRRAWPDLLIAEPQPHGRNWYHGLFIELKKDGEKLYPGPRAKNRFRSIDGKEYRTQHFMEQADVLYGLRKAGYAAQFSIGFEETLNLIDSYLGGEYGRE